MPGLAVPWLQSDPPMCVAGAGQEAPGHLGSLDPMQNCLPPKVGTWDWGLVTLNDQTLSHSDWWIDMELDVNASLRSTGNYVIEQLHWKPCNFEMTQTKATPFRACTSKRLETPHPTGNSSRQGELVGLLLSIPFLLQAGHLGCECSSVHGPNKVGVSRKDSFFLYSPFGQM